MNGRCATDPFDQAVNVCQSCYGEFCEDCLIQVKGRRHPICRECAIIASGVRPGARPAIRGDRKTAKRRRKALAEQQPTQQHFTYFDQESVPAAPPTPTVGDPDDSLNQPTDGLVTEPVHDPVDSLPAAQSPPATSAMDQLEALRGEQSSTPTSNLAALQGLATTPSVERTSAQPEPALPMPSPDIDPFTLKPFADKAGSDNTPPEAPSWTTKSPAMPSEAPQAPSVTEPTEDKLFHSSQ